MIIYLYNEYMMLTTMMQVQTLFRQRDLHLYYLFMYPELSQGATVKHNYNKQLVHSGHKAFNSVSDYNIFLNNSAHICLFCNISPKQVTIGGNICYLVIQICKCVTLECVYLCLCFTCISTANFILFFKVSIFLFLTEKQFYFLSSMIPFPA